MRINRWGILAVLFVARLCAGTQFQSAGSVAPFLARDFAVGYDRIGTLIGLYMVPGLILAVPAGYLGKRFGDRTVVAAATFLMVLSGIVSGLAESYAALVAGRLLGGAGTAFLFVLLIKMLSDWFADKDLFLGMSIFIVGWPVGIASAQATQGLIAEHASWNTVFLTTAVASAVGLVAIAAFYRPPPRPAAVADSGPARLSGKEKWLLAIAGLMWLLINGAYMVVLGFGPVLLIEQGVSVVESGQIVSLMSWVFLFALPLGGYIATRYSIPDVTAIGGLAVCVVVGALIPFTAVPVATFAAFGIAFAIAVPVVSSLPALVLRAENRGPGFGIFQVWYFAGAAFMPMGAGYLHDLTGGATVSMLCAAGMMLAVLCLHVVFRLEQRRLAAD